MAVPSSPVQPAGLLAGGQDVEAGAVSFRFRDGTQVNGVGVEDAVRDHRPGGATRESLAERRGAADRRVVTPDAQDGVGAPDALQRLWTPHRMAYIKREGKSGSETSEGECPFCRIIPMDDAEGLVIARGTGVYAVLNLYPYNPGHLMVVPYRHVADYPELTIQETTELATFTQLAMLATRRAAAPHGFNIGINQGSIAGAGIAAHLHQHVVPRWGGDANFMPVVGGTKVLPQLLSETHTLLVDAWKELS